MFQKRIFLAEVIGTFGLMISATASIVYDASNNGAYGIGFIAIIHFIGIGVLINVFGKYSMAHFNPAVTVCFLIVGYTKKNQLATYFAAQSIGAFLGTIFVMMIFGDFAMLGTNHPGVLIGVPELVGFEVLATVFLIAVILLVVHNGWSKISGTLIAGMISLDVYFLGTISGASMNPIRSLAPAVVSGNVSDLWLYLTTPFIGAIIVAVIYQKKFKKKSLD